MLASALRGSGVSRLVALTHGHEVWWAKTPLTRRLLHRIGEDVDVVTYVSEYCRGEIARALSQAARRRMVRLSPGVNPARFRPGLGRADAREAMGIGLGQPVVLAAGRLVRRKGHDMLIRAWPRVLHAVPDALLLVVGDGPGSRRLQALASRLGVAEAVRHRGGVSWEQMPQVYTAADVFALPCRTRLRGLEPEAFGIVFLEAAAAGLPVIVGESGGAPETVVNGETGYLVDPLDLDQIAGRIISLLTSPGQAGAMGAAGRARVAGLWPESRAVATLKELLS
jgi:phosphatidyl-myo-inositol dimannoside synthase